MKIKKHNFNPEFCIIFWLIGIAIFTLLFLYIKIPVYKTIEGKVYKHDTVTTVLINKNEISADKIYYYVNRDEWIDTSTIYLPETNGYLIDSKHTLENGSSLNIDFQVSTISLFKAIFIYRGNI